MWHTSLLTSVCLAVYAVPCHAVLDNASSRSWVFVLAGLAGLARLDSGTPVMLPLPVVALGLFACVVFVMCLTAMCCEAIDAI